ncbi:MAG: diguanylate cyclase [Gammaproteobacteria bacterium SHHR-1]
MPQILVIEDNRALAVVAKSLIEKEPGYSALVAASRVAALRLIADNPQGFSAAVADLNLPDAPNGEVVTEVIAADIPTLVLTGAYGEDMRERMHGLGVVDYIIKHGVASYEYACDLVRRIHKNRSIKVLLVDDSRSAALVLSQLLQVMCLKPLLARSGKEALELLDQHPDIRLVFTDYHMPQMDGFELCRRIRERHAKGELAIIGLSGQSDARLSSRFLKSGADDFLAKPVVYEELLCRVNQNLNLLEYIETIKDISNRDYLTRLHNRRYFFSKGQALYAQAKKTGSALSAAMIDIDFFKKINDSQGHEGGDVALKHMAELLRNAFAGELVARFGGEEFCILLQQPQQTAQASLDAFRQLVADSPVTQEGYHFGFTLSIGLSDQPGADLDAMLALADAALYRAKQEGRNRLVYADRPLEIGADYDGNIRNRERAAH